MATFHQGLIILKQPSGQKYNHNLEISTCDPLKYKMDIPILIYQGELWVILVRVFSGVLVAFLYFDICRYRQSNLAIENPEFSQPVVAGHFQ